MVDNITSERIMDTFHQLLHLDGGPSATEKPVLSATGIPTALTVSTGSVVAGGVRFSGGGVTRQGGGAVDMPQVSITGGTITGITPLGLAAGGTNAATASGARTNLGLGSIATQSADNVSLTGAFQTAGADHLTLSGVTLEAVGDSGDIDIELTPKGDGLTKTTNLRVTGSIGYDSSVTGSVTQLTSKSTDVTLNAPAGRIMLNDEALGEGSAFEVFTLNNDHIGENDLLVVNIASAGTEGAYVTGVTGMSEGAARIFIRNVSGGSLSEAVELTFVILKVD